MNLFIPLAQNCLLIILTRARVLTQRSSAWGKRMRYLGLNEEYIYLVLRKMTFIFLQNLEIDHSMKAT